MLIQNGYFIVAALRISKFGQCTALKTSAKIFICTGLRLFLNKKIHKTDKGRALTQIFT